MDTVKRVRKSKKQDNGWVPVREQERQLARWTWFQVIMGVIILSAVVMYIKGLL